MEQGTFPKHVFLMRHGEKMSNVTGIKESNTEITYNGENQAFECGNYLASVIQALKSYNKQSQLLIISSPYLRCIHSAAKASESLKENGINLYNDTIYVSTWIKENQKANTDGSRKMPITALEISQGICYLKL